MGRSGIALLLLLALVASAPASAGSAGDFDHYLLALSWSPTYCGTADGRQDRDQCAPGRRFAFVVHGLWPQHRDGWPEFCTGRRGVTEEEVEAMLDVMPSPRLVRHQWAKHGTCSGLAPGDYLALTRRLYERVMIPARYVAPEAPIEVTPGDMVADFVATNRGLDANMLSVRCGSRRDRARLAELRICFSRAGAFQPCGIHERRRQCRAERLVLPPVR